MVRPTPDHVPVPAHPIDIIWLFEGINQTVEFEGFA
jgi:hypothetical protein